MRGEFNISIKKLHQASRETQGKNRLLPSSKFLFHHIRATIVGGNARQGFLFQKLF
jgi:hypothetical protein